MADPATITAVAKAAVAVLSDERIRKTIGWVIAAVLSPLILIIVLVCSLLSGTTNHNNTAVELCFHGGVIPASMPAEYREYIGDMRQSFTLIDGAIANVNAEMEDGDSLDDYRVKAIFYSLFFGAASPSRLEHRRYVNCFVTYEERTRTVENGDGTTSEETYTVAVPIASLPTVYNNIPRCWAEPSPMRIRPTPMKSITAPGTVPAHPWRGTVPIRGRIGRRIRWTAFIPICLSEKRVRRLSGWAFPALVTPIHRKSADRAATPTAAILCSGCTKSWG